jgi:hypothetical protein
VGALSKQLDGRFEQAVVSIDAALDQAARQRSEPVDVRISPSDSGVTRRRHAPGVPSSHAEKQSARRLRRLRLGQAKPAPRACRETRSRAQPRPQPSSPRCGGTSDWSALVPMFPQPEDDEGTGCFARLVDLADAADRGPGAGSNPFCSRARTRPCSASSRLLIASERRLPCAPRVEAARAAVRFASTAGGPPTGSTRIDASTVRSLSRRSRAMIDASIMIPSERRRVRIVRVDAPASSPADARSATLADWTEASRSRRERRAMITRGATPGEPEARRCRRSPR